jgi:Bacterial antitoxin of type II TA system, VapB
VGTEDGVDAIDRPASEAAESYAWSMRTTVDLPEDLIEEARRLWQFRTKQETLIAGLEELVREAHREALRRLAGKVDLDLDFGRSRGKRRKR